MGGYRWIVGISGITRSAEFVVGLEVAFRQWIGDSVTSSRAYRGGKAPYGGGKYSWATTHPPYGFSPVLGFSVRF
jgi:hypothetical protein